MSTRTTNKRETVTQMLREAILDGHAPPDTHLPEMRLGYELKVSQAVVRESLNDLERVGLATKRHRTGTYVIALTPEDVTHIFQARIELEALACCLLAAHLSEEGAQTLQAQIDTMQTASDALDALTLTRSEAAFHRCLWRAQPNRPLERSLETLCTPLFICPSTLPATLTTDYQRLPSQYAEMLRVLRDGDPKQAAQSLLKLLRFRRQLHLKQLERTPALPPNTNALFAYLREQARLRFADQAL